MSKRKALSTGNKIFLFVIQQIVAVIAAACITIVTVSSMIDVNDGFGRSRFFLNPLEYGEIEFEESDVFATVLEHGIRDAVRMSVIKSQLETEGEFDGHKEIDVTAYVNRAEQLSGKYVTAKYRLEDLLKWGKYGFEYTGKVFESETEMEDFLANATTYTQYEGTYTTGFHPRNVGEEEYQERVPAATSISHWRNAENVSETVVEDGVVIISEENGETMVTDYTPQLETTEETVAIAITDVDEADYEYEDSLYQTILTSRYKTIDGKTPQELVSTWEEYYQLCDNIAEAASSLYYNYKEYLDYENSYSLENSNLLYCMEMLVDGKNVYFTNATLKEFGDETINHFFSGFHKNIYYSPYDMEYYTNTGVPEEYFLQLMDEYNYAYNENTKIWIAVDDSYQAEDIFAKAEYAYNTFLPNWWEYMSGAIACIVIYGLLFLVQCTYTGRREIAAETEEGESRVQICAAKFEQIPTEIWLIICGMAAGLMVILLMFTYDMLTWRQVSNQLILKTVAIETGIVSTVLSLLGYSFIRRCKVHNLWRGSFTFILCRWFYRQVLLRVAGAIKTMYGNLPIVLQSLIPYCALIGMNVIGMVFAVKIRSIGVVFLLGIIDAAVGWLLFKNNVDKQKIIDGIVEIRNGDLNYQVDMTKLYGENKILAEAVNSIGDGIREAVETSMKDERLKADLITNVSHDIKTPLTSIINYVDLLKREDIQDEKVKNYIQVLDSKSQRLKQLTDDLVEASKISSGNITLHIERINIVELLNQAIGEFSEKFETKELQTVVTFEKKALYIDADSRRMWRVIENLFNNIFKYAMTGTRVYIDGKEEKEGKDTNVVLTVKNISAQPLNINADELTERFIRGDVSRSTEGSGLGLSIAKNLTEAQSGKFHIYLDGDLFKAMIVFRKAEEGRD